MREPTIAWSAQSEAPSKCLCSNYYLEVVIGTSINAHRNVKYTQKDHPGVTEEHRHQYADISQKRKK